MSSKAPPVLLDGPGSDHDRDLIEGMFHAILAQETDDLELTRNYTGDVVFEARARFTDGVLETIDHSLQRRRRRKY